MATTILTPITLWKDFDDTLPPEAEVVGEREEGDVLHRTLFFRGRQTEGGRVKIFAHFFVPKGAAQYPAVMVLFEAGHPVDETFVSWLTGRGYAVFAPDYCGDDGTEQCTVYPVEIDYANFARAGRAMYHADKTAKETSWYEWAAVARYGVQYLRAQPEVVKVGAIGIRTGGEVLWKIAPFAPLDCMITVCAAGWLAYRGLNKFGDTAEHVFDEERHRFLAGVDSQSYAPYCKCPVLLLLAINDRKYNCDRAYDTFRQINPETEKAILYSARGSGLLGSHSLNDLFLFLDKYLKGRSVFIPKPAKISVEGDGEHDLTAVGTFDEDGVIAECGVFYSEGVTNHWSREWTRLIGMPGGDGEENICRFPLSVCRENEKALAYTFVSYSNGFSVTSRLKEVTLDRPYRNLQGRSRVIYGSSVSGLNGFTPYLQRTRAVADCFIADQSSRVKLLPGYGGIKGIACELGLISHRVGEPRYRPPEEASFQFDVYSAVDGMCTVTFCRQEGETTAEYSCVCRVEGGGKWKSILLEAEEFKSETGHPLPSFAGVTALILSGGGMIFNNLLWL